MENRKNLIHKPHWINIVTAYINIVWILPVKSLRIKIEKKIRTLF